MTCIERGGSSCVAAGLRPERKTTKKAAVKDVAKPLKLNIDDVLSEGILAKRCLKETKIKKE